MEEGQTEYERCGVNGRDKARIAFCRPVVYRPDRETQKDFFGRSVGWSVGDGSGFMVRWSCEQQDWLSLTSLVGFDEAPLAAGCVVSSGTSTSGGI